MMNNIVDISPLQCDKLMMNNTKVVHEMVMIPSIIGSGEYSIRCLKNKSILTTINLHDEKNIKFSGEITSKDIDVMDSVYTIFATGEKCFTLDQVVQVYTGDMNVKITPKMRREVKKSIDKLMTTIVRIDCTEEFQNRKLISKDDKMIFNSNIVHLQYLEGKKAHFTANGRVSNSKVIYRFIGEEAPVLFQYAKAIGQIITVPMNLLTLDANTELSTEICRYVYRQIHYMKYAKEHKDTGRSNKIALYRYDAESKEYVGLMAYIGIKREDYVAVHSNGKEDTHAWRKKKQRVCKIIKNYLDMLVNEKEIYGYKTYFERNKAGNTKEMSGYEIQV